MKIRRKEKSMRHIKRWPVLLAEAAALVIIALVERFQVQRRRRR
jgi:hypothetical protein